MANKGDRGRTFELTLYLDTPEWHDILTKIINVSDSAYVVHDKDIASSEDVEAWSKRYPGVPCPFVDGQLKIEHIHAIVRFPNARYLSAVQAEFGIGSIRKCSSLRGYLRYLVHIDYEDKYQYDKCDVKTFGRMSESFKKALEDEKPFETRVIQLCELLDSCHRFVSKRDFVNLCCEADLFGTLVQMKGWAFAILEEHNSEYVDGVKISY